MSRKHRKQPVKEKVFELKDYTKSNHTKNNFKDFISKATHQELLKEYNKLNLLLQMMKVGHMKGLPTHEKGQENITIVKYKYNLICQEITKRNYSIMNNKFNKSNVRYKHS